MSLNIAFMGSPEFAVPALEGLIRSHHQVVAVYSQPPRPAGRGHKVRPCPVHATADKHDIPVYTPQNFKDAADINALKNLNADIAVVAAYGLLLPQAVLDAFPHGCINIHPSALPRWRGAAPIHRTVLAGDSTTDICIMQMDAGLDTGDVLARESLAVPATITTGQLHDQLADGCVPLLIATLDAIENGTATRKPQSEDGVTYAKKITKAEAKIDWSQTAQDIERQIRGLNPYPAAHTSLNGQPIKIWEAVVVDMAGEQSTVTPGTVRDNNFTIACGGNTSLRPTRVQRPGKAPMPTDEMLRGFPVPKGTRLG